MCREFGMVDLWFRIFVLFWLLEIEFFFLRFLVVFGYLHFLRKPGSSFNCSLPDEWLTGHKVWECYSRVRSLFQLQSHSGSVSLSNVIVLWKGTISVIVSINLILLHLDIILIYRVMALPSFTEASHFADILIVTISFLFSGYLYSYDEIYKATQNGYLLICCFQFLTKSGIYEFWNWFDDRTW